MNKLDYTSKLSSDRYQLLIRGSLLITAGSLIAIFETFIAIYFGLHNVSYRQALNVALAVFSMSAILISISYFKKTLLVWHEWLIFGAFLLFFQAGFSLWVFRLGEIRFLAVINALTTIIILLSYTNIIQSFFISMFVLINYLSVTYYSIEIAGQKGSIVEEIFLILCLIPAFLLISISSYYITNKREELEDAKSELENLNLNLSEINIKLKKEQELSEIEMGIASEIQEAIFPAKVPYTDDWDIAFLTKPYGAVSGDFYDFYTDNNILKGVSLFDVSGHGIAPALITILAKPIIYHNFKFHEADSLGRVLENSNTELFDELEAVNLYITGMLLRMSGTEIEYINAGHPEMLHYRSDKKDAGAVAGSKNFFKGQPIGISSTGLLYPSLKFTIPIGDFLILYSDGLTESRNSDGYEFGISRLIDSIKSFSGKTAVEMLNLIVKSLNDFAGNTKAGDDITIIIVGRK